MGLIIRGGTVVDAHGERRADVAVGPDGRIAAVGSELDARAVHLDGVGELDALGCLVVPGLVDLHTHLREPGREEAETIETGSRAAARGGFTAVVAMPNTEPAIDSAGVVRQVLDAGRSAGLCDVHTSGAITVGREGTQLAPMAEMAALGISIIAPTSVS
jgi:dihydroorotase